MKGFVISQEGHVAQLLAPVSTSGGKTAFAFGMQNYQHASIIILQGAVAGQETSIVVNNCSNQAGANATPMPFNVFKAETANTDVLGAKTPITSAGFQPTATGGTFYVIEMDAAELPQGQPYVQVVIANGANADFCAVLVVLSGSRFAEDQSPSVLV
jgi:hypothetical protein